jgi:hypothetical protein
MSDDVEHPTTEPPDWDIPDQFVTDPPSTPTKTPTNEEK